MWKEWNSVSQGENLKILELWYSLFNIFENHFKAYNSFVDYGFFFHNRIHHFGIFEEFFTISESPLLSTYFYKIYYKQEYIPIINLCKTIKFELLIVIQLLIHSFVN